MPKISSRIREKRSATINIKEAFRNEDGAIDLASIMVGIIVIGLIGGVIAATVFAVIPWSQDNAAKHQLDSIHSAQNAHFGLVSDPSRILLAGEQRNSFTNSATLASSNLLTAGATFCTEPADGGKDYIAYSKSSSGTIFISKNSDKKAASFTGEITGDCSFITDGSTSESSPPEPEIPVGPVASPGYKILDYWDFETDVNNKSPLDWPTTTYISTSVQDGNGHDGTKGLWASKDSNQVALKSANKHLLSVGKTYKVSFWIKTTSSSALDTPINVTNTTDKNHGTKYPVRAGNWTKVEAIVQGAGHPHLFITTTLASGNIVSFIVDDIKLEEQLN